MHKFLPLIFIMLAVDPLAAQNLVVNPSFEIPVAAFRSGDGGWQKCLHSDTPDQFTDSVHQTLFTRYRGGAIPHTGNSFAGIFILRFEPGRRGEIREFIQTQLVRQLKKDTIYDVEAWVRLDAESNVACNGIGFYFSDSLVRAVKAAALYECRPQVRVNNPADNTGEWKKLSGRFRARGYEKYLVIGNFNADSETPFREVRPVTEGGKKKKWLLGDDEKVSYIYIDDVKVAYNDSLNRVFAERLRAKSLRMPVKPVEEAEIVASATLFDASPKVKEVAFFHRDINANLYEPVKGQRVNFRNILFEFGKADFMPAALTELNELLKLLRKSPGTGIDINGHTDNVGNLEFNMALSLARAEAVKKFLAGNGIDPARMNTYGFAFSQPVDSNLHEEGRANNRRIEIVFR